MSIQILRSVDEEFPGGSAVCGVGSIPGPETFTCITKKKKKPKGIPVVAQLASMRIRVPSLASLSGLRIWHCRGLWCRLQTPLGSGAAVAVAWAGSCSSNLTPILGTSICHTCSPKRPKKKKKWMDGWMDP